MQQHEAGLRAVPALVGIGIASWTLIAAGVAAGRNGYAAPVAVGAAIFIMLAALVLRAAARHGA